MLQLDGAGGVVGYEEYTPYGSTSYRASANLLESPGRYRYSGKERDEESGLYAYGARYYAPWLGRWTSADKEALMGYDVGRVAFYNDQKDNMFVDTVRAVEEHGLGVIPRGMYAQMEKAFEGDAVAFGEFAFSAYVAHPSSRLAGPTAQSPSRPLLRNPRAGRAPAPWSSRPPGTFRAGRPARTHSHVERRWLARVHGDRAHTVRGLGSS